MLSKRLDLKQRMYSLKGIDSVKKYFSVLLSFLREGKGTVMDSGNHKTMLIIGTVNDLEK